MLPRDTFWLGAGLVVGAVVGLLVGLRSGGSPHRRLAVAAACAHVGAVLAVTLFPLPMAVAEPFDLPYANAQLVPLRTISMLLRGSQSVRQLGGNLLLLAPMGVLVPVAWRSARPFLATVAVGLATSLAIELLQLLVGSLVGELYRVVDVDDVLLNTLGVVAGRAVLALCWPVWRRLRER